MSPDLAAAQERAHLLVTCLFNDDRDMVGREMAALGDIEVLRVALVALDLVAYVHHRWSVVTGIDRDMSWRELLADVAEWREREQAT